MNNDVINSGNNNVSNINTSGNNNSPSSGGSNTTSEKNNYTIAIVIVVIVLLIAIFLLILLLTGNINGKNKLTCTLTTQESGYTYTVVKNYTFDDEVMKRVDYVYTYKYLSELTDNMYNEEFKDTINPDNRGITGYGYNTQISKNGNIVTIIAFDPSFFNESYDLVVSTNKDEGYTCE